MKKFALLLGCLPLLMLSCSKEPVKEPVTVSFGVEISVTDSSASVVVTPSDVEVPYYCDVFTADEYEATGGTAADAGNSIVGKYISGEIGDGDLATGKNTFDFKDLEAASDYVAVCVGIVDGEAIETAEANEFRTKEKAEQPEDPDDPDEPEEPEYDFSLGLSLIGEADYRFADIKVEASDENTMYVLVPTVNDEELNYLYGWYYMPDGLSDDEIFASYVETFSAFAERNGMEFSAYMEYLLENGTYFYKGSKESMRIDDLRENIDFVVYAVGIDLEANRLSEVARLPFKTNYAEYIDCSFDVKTSVDGLNIHVEVTPSDPDAYWYYGIRETSRYEAAVYPFANVELFVADEASTVISGATFENPDATFEELAESLMYKGKKVFDHKMDAAETGYTYYMAAVLPVNFMQVYPISEGVAEEIFTDKAEQKGLTFEITAAADGPETGHVTVVPSNNEDQYVFDCVPLSQWKSWSDEERMANWVKRYGVYFNIGQRVYKGEQAKTDMELYPNTEYIAFAFGYDNGGTTTEFFSKTFTTPALADPSGLELDVKYYDLTYNTVKVDVTPNSDDIFYFVGLAPTQGFNIETYAKELEDDIQYTLNYMMDMSGHENYVVAEDVYEKCLRGAQTGMNPYHLGLPNYMGLEAGTSYTFYWFAVSTDTGECVKKESIPDFIVTPVMYGGTATVSVEVMGFYDQEEANKYVDPDYFPYQGDPRVVLPIEITGMSDDAVEVWYGFSGGANFEEVTDEWLFTYGIGGFIRAQWDDIDKVMYRQNEHYEDYVWFFFAAKDKNGVFGPITRIGIDTPEGGQSDIEELKAFYEERKDNMY